MHSNKETFVKAITPHDASAYLKMRLAAVCPRIKRVLWILKEDAIVLKIRDKDSYL